MLRRGRPLRGPPSWRFRRDFIARFAPQIDGHDLRRAFDHGIVSAWPVPPCWSEWKAAS